MIYAQVDLIRLLALKTILWWQIERLPRNQLYAAQSRDLGLIYMYVS